MKNLTLILISIVLMNLSLAQNIDEVILDLQKKFQTINNFTADFKQSTGRSSEKNSFSLKGEFTFSKKNNFIIEFLTQTIVSDGETIWNFNKKMDRVVISSFENEPNAFSVNSFIMDYPAKCKLELVDKTTIKMIPSTEEIQFSSVVIKFNKDMVIYHIEVVDFSETKYIVDLYNLKLNQKLDNKIFKFTPPEGTQIVDLR